MRWWSIAKTMIRIAFKKKFTWVLSALSAWYYFAMIFIMFLLDAISANLPPGQPSPIEQLLGRIVWKDQFLHGLSYGQIVFFSLSLVIGAGAIANDNRSNALLVYLSKPVTKRDYLLGKWMGVFLPILLLMLIPSAIFFLYGFMSYRERGFVTQDPWLALKLLAIYPIVAAFHASLITGISSMFNQGRVAGAAYAGLYFLTNFFTVMMAGLFNGVTRSHGAAPLLSIANNLFYASVDGLCIGLGKAILGTDGTFPFGLPATRQIQVPAPPLIPVLGIMVLTSVAMLLIAWRRIRAVEVVG